MAGTPTEGTIDSVGDIDRYAVALEGSTTYYFRMQGFHSRNGDLTDPNISAILNVGGTPQTLATITEATTIGLDSWVKMTTAATPATYYIVAEGTGTDGAFLLTSTKDVPGGTTTTASVTVGGSVTGFIDEGTDADWYSVTLGANTSYVVKMLGVDSGNGTLVDPMINGVRFSASSTTIITGTAGATVATIDNAVGRDSVARLVSGTAGTYYIAAENGGTTSVGSYVLSISPDAGQTTATAWTTLAVDGFVNGTIDDAPDADWYKIALANNTSYVFKMLGTDSGNGTLDDPLLALQNSTGTAVTTNRILSSIGMDSVMRFFTATAGDFYINAQGAGADNGTFRLTAEREAGNTTGTVHSIAVGSSLVGAIDDATDIDWYAVTLAAGTRYRVRMEGLDSGQGTLADPWLNGVHTSAGAVITTSTGSAAAAEGGGTGKDAYLIFTNTTAGTYYIYADTTPAIVGTYKLSVELW